MASFAASCAASAGPAKPLLQSLPGLDIVISTRVVREVRLLTLACGIPANGRARPHRPKPHHRCTPFTAAPATAGDLEFGLSFPVRVIWDQLRFIPTRERASC
jgi:hypothetical protein